MICRWIPVTSKGLPSKSWHSMKIDPVMISSVEIRIKISSNKNTEKKHWQNGICFLKMYALFSINQMIKGDLFDLSKSSFAFLSRRRSSQGVPFGGITPEPTISVIPDVNHQESRRTFVRKSTTKDLRGVGENMTLKLTASLPLENGWLEDEISFWDDVFSEDVLV